MTRNIGSLHLLAAAVILVGVLLITIGPQETTLDKKSSYELKDKAVTD